MNFNSEVSFFDAQPMFVCEQVTLKIFDVNKAATDLLGFSSEYLVGKRILKLGSKVDPSSLNLSSKAQKMLNSTGIWEFKCEDGSSKYFQLSAHMIKYKGDPSKLVIAHNITDLVTKRFVRDELLSSQISFNNFPLAEIEWDAQMNVSRWSKKAEDLFGYTSEEVVSEKGMIKEFIHDDDLDYVMHHVEKTLEQGGRELTLINRNVTKTGEVIYCEWYNSLMYDSDNNMISMYSLTHDVTEREEALLETKRSMMSYQDLFNSISDAIYLINKKGHIIEVNEGLEYTFGYNRNEVVGKHIRMLIAPGKFDENRIGKIFEKAEKGLAVKYEGWGRKNNGEVFPTEFLVNTGNYFGEDVFIIIERDISERRASEEALKKREGLLSKLFNSSPVGIALLNEHHEVEMVNDGFEQLFGYRENELKGLDLDKLIVPECEQRAAEQLSESEKIKQVTQKRIRKDGSVIDVIIYAVPVVVEKSVVGIYGLYVDITDRIKAENKIQESLQEKEMLLAEIHHRVKNNLAVITGLLELQTYSTESESAKEVLRESQMRVNSIAMVHEKLYNSEDFSEVNIAQYFEELSEVIYNTLKTNDKKVDIILDLEDTKLPIIQAIPCGLLLNEILTNSMKHAFKGLSAGKFRLKLRKENNSIYVEMCDNGLGMPDTSDVDINSSMGMTLIKALAKQLDASLDIDSKNGTCFRFSFEKKEGEKFDGDEGLNKGI
ncbi:PAS domain S-box protein [Gracilimonas sp. Q87]|uniref:PAS domain-containing sensor histidine kinase n=1 Tax=Gracilimonas sp. Q87 TaxID=3384766 RepID=UPI0039845F2F